MLLLVAKEPRSPSISPEASGRRRTRIVRRANCGIGMPQFLDEVEFGAFGKMSDEILFEPKSDCAGAIVHWLAMNARDESREALERRCSAEMPSWFKPWRSINLFDHSLRLPRGRVVMHVVQEPVNVPGNPPAAVMERWVQSINRHPEAVGYYMEPVFERPEDAGARPLTPDQLAVTISAQWDSIWQSVRKFGWALRLHAGVQARAAAFIQAVNDWIDERERIRQRALREEIARGVTQRAKAIQEARRQRREEELQLLNARLGGRSMMSEDEALSTLSRRQFNTALMLGLVDLPVGRHWRYDPVLTIQLPVESVNRLVGHWDSWNIERDGKKQLATFIHI